MGDSGQTLVHLWLIVYLYVMSHKWTKVCPESPPIHIYQGRGHRSVTRVSLIFITCVCVCVCVYAQAATIPAVSYLLGRWSPPDERSLLFSIANTGLFFFFDNAHFSVFIVNSIRRCQSMWGWAERRNSRSVITRASVTPAPHVPLPLRDLPFPLTDFRPAPLTRSGLEHGEDGGVGFEVSGR